VIMKEGVAHHPHSLETRRDRDWIEQHMQPVDANRPAFADSNLHQDAYYSLDSSTSTEEGEYYARFADRDTFLLRSLYKSGDGNFHAMRCRSWCGKAGSGQAVVFHPSFLERDSTVALALLAKGYYIVQPQSGVGGRAKEVGRGL